jgi:DNA-binding NtrC family response regulator
VILGETEAIRELRRQIVLLGDSSVPVIITGETGTGKGLVARAIHDQSGRASRPFVSAIPSGLQAFELFGHECGAFSGATDTSRGPFERAWGGTLFLDEIADTSTATQGALLRAMQERTIRREGGTLEIPVDVRIITATQRDLEREMVEGRFRDDLYCRLAAYQLRVPSLRERIADLPLLVGRMLEELELVHGLRCGGITREAVEVLATHSWPGNVRELQNAIHRAVLAADGDPVWVAHLPENVRRPEVQTLSEVERRQIIRALESTSGNVAQAARVLGIGRATLYRRLDELGLGSDLGRARRSEQAVA